jgi:capsular exopolysaccharide synthesis family protein
MRELSPYFVRRSLPPAIENTAVSNRPVFLEEEDTFDLRGYWGVLKKRKWHVLTCFLTVVITVAFYSYMTTPIYTAEATLLIEQKAPQVINIQQALSDSLSLGTDKRDYYETQYEILKSRSLAAQVIREQGLQDNGALAQPESKGWVTGLWDALGEWAAKQQWIPEIPSLGSAFKSDEADAPPKSDEADAPPKSDASFGVRTSLINKYIYDMLEISPLGKTRLVKVALSTSDPELSARLANAHAQAYINQGLTLRTRANEEAEHFLEGKLTELKGRVEKSENVLNQYRRIKGIISLDEKGDIVTARLTDLNKNLVVAETERIALEAQVLLINKRSYDSLPAVINNELIRTLTEQLTRLKGDYASLSTQFKSGYPRAARLKAQMEETQHHLEREIQKVVKGIKSAYLAAEAKEKKLATALQKQKEATLSLKDASVEYTILAREVDTNRQLYESVLQRMKEMGVTAGIRSSNVVVIDEAIPPVKPSQPKTQLNLMLAALIGLVGGVGLAFFFEYLDNSLKTPEEIEHYLHLPNLGVVPDFASFDRLSYFSQTPSRPLSQEVLRPPSYRKDLVLSYHPFSPIAEMYRMMHTAILLSQAEEPPKIILFTSGTQGEGKTTTVINTAITFAQMEARVLVIDADLRHSSCHRVLQMKDGLGLTELLTGQRDLKEVIKPTGLRNLSLISGGSVPPNPVTLLGSKRMYEILTFLREDYDYIFIDSPPVVPVTDAVLLSTMVDGVVLVVNSQGTPKQVIKKAYSRLNYARAKVLGVVLNRVIMQSIDDYYYSRHSHVDPPPSPAGSPA